MNTVTPDNNLTAAKDIIAHAKHGKHTFTIDAELQPRTAPAFYAACKWSFVAHLHGGITSTLGYCPTMMYAFDPKHVGIMEAMGLSQLSLRAAHAPSNSAVQMAAILDATDQDLRRDVENRQLQHRELATILVALVEEFFARPPHN